MLPLTPPLARMQFFKPDNWFDVREALLQANRQDLTGGGCDALIPANLPKKALEAKHKRANQTLRSGHSHSVANPTAGEEVGE